MPPWSLSHWVYTARPTGTSTSLAHTQLSSAMASGPSTVNLAKEVWSNRPTALRTASHSSPLASNQFCGPQL